MPKYEVQWVRRYYIAGTVEVEADDEVKAHDAVLGNIGVYTGSLQPEPDGDEAYVLGENKEKGEGN